VGGYHNRHAIRKIDGAKMIAPVTFADTAGDPVAPASYCDDQHGFLRLSVELKTFPGRCYRAFPPAGPTVEGQPIRGPLRVSPG
jgi:hypothetical protein